MADNEAESKPGEEKKKRAPRTLTGFNLQTDVMRKMKFQLDRLTDPKARARVAAFIANEAGYEAAAVPATVGHRPPNINGNNSHVPLQAVIPGTEEDPFT
jgi:hypothetical protein